MNNAPRLMALRESPLRFTTDTLHFIEGNALNIIFKNGQLRVSANASIRKLH